MRVASTGKKQRFRRAQKKKNKAKLFEKMKGT